MGDGNLFGTLVTVAVAGKVLRDLDKKPLKKYKLVHPFRTQKKK